MKREDQIQKDIEDLNEWQENQDNPGYYIGSGRIKRPILGLAKYPVLMIIIGVVMLIPAIIMVLLTDTSVMEMLMLFLLGTLFIVGGVLRIKEK